MTDQFAHLPSPDDLRELCKPPKVNTDIESQTLFGRPIVMVDDMPPMGEIAFGSKKEWVEDKVSARGLPDNWGPRWAAAKLDMPRRRRELESYIDRWLPELRTMPKGLVVDIGAGPGDFLALCQEMGHEGIGIDSPDGKDGMGAEYIKRCREERRRLGVTVIEHGIHPFLEAGVSRVGKFGLPLRVESEAVCVHLRGSIEQCFSGNMTGESHELHHEAKRLDWDTRLHDFGRLFLQSFRLLRIGGFMMIAANGTATTDLWYCGEVLRSAKECGFKLVNFQGFLNHKWVKP